MDSDNLQAPAFGPTWPLYPEVAQLNRVAEPALAGTNIYPAFTVQHAGGLVLRDREPSYVYEPNGVRLSPAIYDCRLIGSHLGRPLYATTCCVGGSSGSGASVVQPSVASAASAAPASPRSSSSFSSSASPAMIEAFSLGGGVVTLGKEITLQNVTTPPGSLLVVVAATIGVSQAGAAGYDGTVMTEDAESTFTNSGPVPGRLFCFSTTDTGFTDDVVFFVLADATLTIQALYVTGLESRVKDRSATASNAGGNPTVTTAVTTTARQYAQAAFALLSPTVHVWLDDFVSGGQDQSGTSGVTPFTVTEARKVLSTAQAVTASMSGVPAAYAGLAVTYR